MPRPSYCYSEAGTTTPSLSSASQPARSGRSSPVKRELALRQATDLPVERRAIQDLTASRLVELVERISLCGDKEGILPSALEQQIRSGETIDDRARPRMFANDARDTSHQTYEYQRILHICRNSLKCADAAHPVHEVEWNERVHAPMLELAFEQQEARAASEERRRLVYHNVTNVRTDQLFRDQDLFLKENKIDYGVFLAPSSDSALGRRIVGRSRRARRDGLPDQVHALESFEPDRPLAIAVETKRHRGGDGYAPSQLANWARIHFRAVSHFIGQEMDGEAAPPCPLVEIEGTTWYASFAVRQDSAVKVYSGIRLGSTERLTDCYALLRSLECLADWARSTCWDWWELQLPMEERQPT
ncbi:hypothetical protein B0I35DRAFT_92089 [Stachybotrys elegans]|uniref:PD-(D/E)XK nuclease-like domain-containing protein n=1 Tax=Stachybotrys elegans TaxID=80388 RepID=A0A8K0SLN1_9HYPO|nr:hypothetical protein B0I35DRAFT_92089 [Stachybotrys elegans]